MLSAALVLTIVGGTVTACGQDAAAPAPSPSVSSIFSTPPSVYEEQRAEGVAALLDKLNDVLTTGTRQQLDELIDPLADPVFRRWWQDAQGDLSAAAAPTSTSVRNGASATSESGDDEPAESAGDDETEASSSGSARPSGSASTRAQPRSRGKNLVPKTLAYRLAANTGPDRLIGGELGVKLTEAGSSDSWVSPVKLRYALGGAASPGVDEPAIELPGMLAFSRYGDDWKLLGDGSVAPDPTGGSEDPARPPEVPPWAFGGLRAADVRTEGGSSAVLSYTGTDRTVERARTQLPAAVAAVSDFWGSDWSQKAVVMATASNQQFAAFTRTAPGSTPAAAAATVYSRIDGAKQTVIGQRIVLSPAASQLTGTGLGVVLRHELFHVATRLSTAEGAPMWLTEGVAEYVGRRDATGDLTELAPDLAVQVAAGQVPAGLPADDAFSVANVEARVAYQTAWSFAAFVADAYGDDRLKQMYLAAAQGGDDKTVAAALQQTLGTPQAQVISRWQTWLKREVR